MDRLRPLLSRMEDESNEELFSLITSQVARVYAEKAAECTGPLFTFLMESLCATQMWRRLVGAAVLEKAVSELERSERAFWVDEREVEGLRQQLEEERRSKGKGKEFEELLNINVATASHDALKRLIGRRENFLYSKSESKLEKKEKGMRARKGNEEDEDIEEWTERMVREENREDRRPEKKKDKKRVKLETVVSVPAREISKPTSLPELLLTQAYSFAFDSRWEVRHGALLVFRAISRTLCKMRPAGLLGPGALKDDARNVAGAEVVEKVYYPDKEHLDRVRGVVNEDIKQKSLLLLSLDCFSDFVSDKSNMINRGLAAEILVTTFKANPNLTEFSNFFDFLFNQKAEHWHSKQALIYLCKQLVENVGKTHVRIVGTGHDQQIVSSEYVRSQEEGAEVVLELPEVFLKGLLSKVTRVFTEHEEVTEVCLELLSSMCNLMPDILAKEQIEKFATLCCQTLRDTPEISFLPYFAFEFFQNLLACGRLPLVIEENMNFFLKKFLFHENAQVRTMIFSFLVNFFDWAKTEKKALDLSFYFQAILLAHLLQKSNTSIAARLVVFILESCDGAAKSQLVSQLLRVTEAGNLSGAIECLGAEFHLTLDQNPPIDTFSVVELQMAVFEQLQEIHMQEIQQIARGNTLVNVPFLLSKRHPSAADAGVLLDLAPADFKLAWLDQRLERSLNAFRAFFAKNKAELMTIKCNDAKVTLVSMMSIVKEGWKNSLIDFQNLCVKFSAQIREGMEENKVTVQQAQVRVQLEGELLVELSDLCKKLSQHVNFLRASASSRIMSLATSSKTRPTQKPTSLIRPLFETLELPGLPETIVEKFCETLFQFISLYNLEADSTNSKIQAKMLKSAAASADFRSNIGPYFRRVFDGYGENALGAFPELKEFFENEEIMASLGHLALGLDVRRPGYSQSIELMIVRKVYEMGRVAEALCSPLFAQLRKGYLAGKPEGLGVFMHGLVARFRSRSPLALKIVGWILQKSPRDFVTFSKIFVPETIPIIIQPGELTEAYELFVRLLATAGIENQDSYDLLDEELKTAVAAGTMFLLDFKNSKNFQFDESLLKRSLLPGVALRCYQMEGIRWLLFLFKYGLSGSLCDDMGLGKTLQTLVSLAVLSFSSPEAVSIVIVPTNLVYHWEKECQRYISKDVMKCVVLASPSASAGSNLKQLIGDARLVIVSYNTFGRTPWLQEQQYLAAVIDEAHLIKNPKSVIAQNVKKVRSRVKVALTGTPIQNNVLELWSIFDYLMPGYLGTQEKFRKEFRALIDLNLLSCELNKMDLSANQKTILNDLHMRVLPFIMRREKTEVLKDLPPKIIQDIDCELTPVQARMYEKLEDARMSEENPSFLSYLSGLLKLINHPLLVAASIDSQVLQKVVGGEEIMSHAASGKFNALSDLMSELGFTADSKDENLACTNKVLIFTRSNKTLDLIEKFLSGKFPALQFCALKPQQTPLERALTCDKFNTNSEKKVLLLTPKTGGLGLNLSSANVVVMFDHDFNPMSDLQAMDRAHRLGQTKVVNVYRLITRGTIEEKIMGIQRFKLAVTNTVITSENASISNVQSANFLENLESVAAQNRNTPANAQSEQGGDLKIFKNLNLPEMWDPDEYDKEFL